MNLKCKINNVEYKIVDGATFSEEYNETLDSGEIIISQVGKIDIKPFDDVYITGRNGFYKHFLIDSFIEERLNLTENLYKYKISLFSETKGLERVQIPNITITQPLVLSKRKSVYDYLKQFVNQYSPKIKVAKNENEWEYKNKYTLSFIVKSKFDNVFCPDFSLNNPTLRDVLTQLMIVKDMIPYVKDNVIYALDITARNGEFDMNPEYVNNIVSSMASDSYTDNLKRNYNEALSQDNATHMVEYLGFRNSDEALLTIENLRLETRFPIYKVNRVLMCYYKKVQILEPNKEVFTNMMMLCKQDITKLVKLESERNLLSKDWDDFSATPPANIDILANYRLATVGYEMGSKEIGGWGTKYTYPKGWWDVSKTYVENIVAYMDETYPYGINTYGYIKEMSETSGTIKVEGTWRDNLITPFSNASAGLKSLFFIVDYDGFYSGTVIHSKDDSIGELTINDNPSSSLTVLESDGLYEKEKANRLGNKVYQINARYREYYQIQKLGSVYDDDIIIFSRQYSIYDNVINCNYIASKDYVLKNYFNTVYAKHRTHNLLSYGESVTRAENRKVFLFLSTDKVFYENFDGKSGMKFEKFNDKTYELLSAFMPSPLLKSVDNFDKSKKINAGYFEHNNKYYLSDVNAFVSGYSLCFNISMYDNVSSGVYISVAEAKGRDNTYVGSKQDWHLMVDNVDTGFIENLGIYVCHLDQSDVFNDKVEDYYKPKITNIYNNVLFNLPQIDFEPSQTSNLIGGDYQINKDNKEILDMTFQIEPITDDNNVLFSQWFMKLSDLIATYNKVDRDYTVEDTNASSFDESMYLFTQNVAVQEGVTIVYYDRPMIQLNISDANYNNFINNTYRLLGNETWESWINGVYHSLNISLGEINVLSASAIAVKCRFKHTMSPTKKIEYDKWVIFYKLGTGGATNNPYFYNKISPSGFTSYGVMISEAQNNYGQNVNISLSNGHSASSPKNQAFFVETRPTEKITKTYPRNMFAIYDKNYLKKTLVYDEYASVDDMPDNFYYNGAYLTAKMFSVQQEEDGRPYIQVCTDLTDFHMQFKSIGFWYYDEVTHGLKFVFGVNLEFIDKMGNLLPNQPDRENICVYASLITSKDMKVYTSFYTVRGEVLNYNDSNKKYGVKQYYNAIID